MTIALRDLTTLDPAAVQQAADAARAAVVELNPALDTRRGVLFDVLIYFHAILAAQQAANVADYQAARSLAAIEADPTLADPALVDDVLSNYRVTRRAGVAATGEVTIVVSGSTTVTIGVGAVFEAQGQQYTADSTFTAKQDPAQLQGPGDRLLVPTADGKFAFTITVTASTPGAAGRLTRNTTIVPVALPGGYVTSYAASDFSGGTDAETNADLLLRLQQGAATRCLSNRGTMEALLRNTDATSGFVASSIIGYGDPEMLRDKHTIFPVACGGRADWYVRTQPAADRVRITVAATLVAIAADGTGTWQATLGRDQAAGTYEVATILPAGAPPGSTLGSLPVIADERGLDLTGGGFVPDLVNGVEGAFSRYQTITVQFADTEAVAGGAAVGSSRAYDLELVRMPQIDLIQDMIAARDVRHFGADCLVKAPVPCFVQVTLTVFKQPGAADPDVAAIQSAIAAAINATGFTGRLYASTLQDAAAPYVQAPTALSRLDLLGRLRYPTLETGWLRSSEVLTVVDDASRMTSPRTVQFFSTAEDVAVSVVTAIPSAT